MSSAGTSIFSSLQLFRPPLSRISSTRVVFFYFFSLEKKETLPTDASSGTNAATTVILVTLTKLFVRYVFPPFSRVHPSALGPLVISQNRCVFVVAFAPAKIVQLRQGS